MARKQLAAAAMMFRMYVKLAMIAVNRCLTQGPGAVPQVILARKCFTLDATWTTVEQAHMALSQMIGNNRRTEDDIYREALGVYETTKQALETTIIASFTYIRNIMAAAASCFLAIA
jgi:hypothetical protein